NDAHCQDTPSLLHPLELYCSRSSNVIAAPPPAPVLPPPAAARRSCPWPGRGRALRPPLGAPAPIGRAWHRVCPGRGGSAPGEDACRVPRPGRGLGGSGLRRARPRGIAPRCNVAEQAQGICLVAAFLARTGERQRLLGEGLRLLQTASQQLRLPQRETA